MTDPLSAHHQTEYLIEFKQVGNSIKVTAIDPVSGTEVSIVGDPKASQDELSRVAVDKLLYVLKKQRNDRESR